MMYEHEILPLGLSKRKKAKELMDKKAKEGWELVTVVPDFGMNQQGMMETKMNAVFKRPIDGQATCCGQHK